MRGRTGAIKIGNSPKTFINWAEVKVDADLVVLERNKRERKTWVAAEPELEWNVKGSFRKRVFMNAKAAESTVRMVMIR